MSEQNRESDVVLAAELAERFARNLLRYWAAVLVLVVCSTLALMALARWQYAPKYEATARFSVSSSYAGDSVFSAAYYDNAAAQQLADAFPYLLEMDLMKDLMKQALGTDYIGGTITPYSVASTNMFVLKVESGDPQRSYDILMAVIESFPKVGMYMVDNPRVDVLDEIKVPTQVMNPFSWRSALVSAGLWGLVIAAGFVGLTVFFAKNITSVRQLKSIANVPVLATFPKLPQKKRRSRKEVLVTAQSDQGFEESLRGLSLKLKKALAQSENRVVAVTSTCSGEGKTTTAANLAMALAEDGSRVVLVDGDLRNQSVARLLEGSLGKGLLDCLRDEGLDVLECLQQMPGERVMYLSGNSAPDWRYAIDQRNLRRVLERLKTGFDYVVLDTAPCAQVADTALVCRFSGSVLYVVRSDWARESQVIDQVSMLHERDVKLSGFVYNGAPRYRSGYGYGYGGYGGYGYGTKKR